MTVLIEGERPLMVVKLLPYDEGVLLSGVDSSGDAHPILVIDGDGVIHWPQSMSESTGWEMEDEHLRVSGVRAAIG